MLHIGLTGSPYPRGLQKTGMPPLTRGMVRFGAKSPFTDTELAEAAKLKQQGYLITSTYPEKTLPAQLALEELLGEHLKELQAFHQNGIFLKFELSEPNLFIETLIGIQCKYSVMSVTNLGEPLTVYNEQERYHTSEWSTNQDYELSEEKELYPKGKGGRQNVSGETILERVVKETLDAAHDQLTLVLQEKKYTKDLALQQQYKQAVLTGKGPGYDVSGVLPSLKTWAAPYEQKLHTELLAFSEDLEALKDTVQVKFDLSPRGVYALKGARVYLLDDQGQPVFEQLSVQRGLLEITDKKFIQRVLQAAATVAERHRVLALTDATSLTRKKD